MAWLTDYSYRKSITLSRASGAVTNYQMYLPVGESSGATGESVDCGGHCASDFDDIRFTTSDGETLLDYWIESISGTTPNQLANIWIEFDSIGTGDTTFYMYYGNAGAAAYSNGDNTFPFFDHFDGDLSKWTINYGTPAVASSIVTFNGTSQERITTTATYGTNYAFRAQVGMDGSYAGGITFNEHHGLSNYTDGSAKFSMRTYRADWGAQTTTDISNRISGSNVLELRRNASTSVIAVINNWVAATHTSNFVTDAAGGRIGLALTGGTFTSDWALIRQYLATEPAWGSWGAEESSSTTELEDVALYLEVGTRSPVRVTSAPLEIISDDPCSHNIRVTSTVLEIISTEYVVSVADDSRLELSAYYQELEDARLYVNVAGLAPLEDAAMWLRAHDGLEFNDALMYLYTQGYEYDNALMYLTTCIYELEDAALYLQAASSTVYGDAPMYLTVTDGITYDDCSLYLTAVANVPAAMSSVYHRLTSIISEV